MDAAVNYEWKLIDTQFIFDVGVQTRENAKEMFLPIAANVMTGICFQWPMWKEEDETTDRDSQRVRNRGKQSEQEQGNTKEYIGS